MTSRNTTARETKMQINPRYMRIEKQLVEGKEYYWIACLIVTTLGLALGLGLGLGLKSSSSTPVNNSPFTTEILVTNAVGAMISIPKDWCNQKWCTKLASINSKLISVAHMGDSTTSGYCVDSIPFQSWSSRQQQGFISNGYPDAGAGLMNCNYGNYLDVFQDGCEFPDGRTNTQILGKWGSFFGKGSSVEIGYLQAQVNPCIGLTWSIDNINWYTLAIPVSPYTTQYRSYFVTIQSSSVKPYAFNISNPNYLTCSIIIPWIRSTTSGGGGGIVFDNWGYPGQAGGATTYPTTLAIGSSLKPDLLIWSFGIWDLYFASCNPNGMQTAATSYLAALDAVIAGIGIASLDVIIDIPNIGTIICNDNMTLYYTYWAPIILAYAKSHGYVYIDQSIIYSSNTTLGNWQSFQNVLGWADDCNGASGPSNIHANTIGYELYTDHSLYVLSATKFGTLPNKTTYLQSGPLVSNYYYSCPFICSSQTSSFNAVDLCASVGGSYSTGAPGYGC